MRTSTDRPKPVDTLPRDLLPIIRRSGVLTDQQFEGVRAKVVEGEYPSDAIALARRLVADRILTVYQGHRLLRDEADGLANDRYVILEHLGSGAAGRVYKARHRLMDRIVALKFIAPEFRSNPRKIARFQREMRLISRLDHPHVVRAFDADRIGDATCLVMEYVPGKTLEQRLLTRGPLSPGKVLHYAAQAAWGLAHAHAQGIIHRDIKPSNLLVGGDGQVKILDFGLGVLMEATDETDSFATLDGATVGTIEYMSPEQASGRELDGRSDLYSLGCTIYHLLTGQVPFPGASNVERLAKRITGRPLPVTDLLPDLPPRVVHVLDRLTATRPEDRYPTADDAAEALQVLTRPKSGRTPGRPTAHPQDLPPSNPASIPTPASASGLIATSSLSEAAPNPLPPAPSHPWEAPGRGDPVWGMKPSQEAQRLPAFGQGRDALAVHRAALEEAGEDSGREAEQSYNDTIARLNQAEIDRLTRACDEARRQAAEAARRKEGISEILQDLFLTLKDKRSPARLLLALVALVFLSGFILAKILD